MTVSDASLAYARVTSQIPRKDGDPTIEQDAVALAAEVQRLTFLLVDLNASDRQLREALADLSGMIERRVYR